MNLILRNFRKFHHHNELWGFILFNPTNALHQIYAYSGNPIQYITTKNYIEAIL